MVRWKPQAWMRVVGCALLLIAGVSLSRMPSVGAQATPTAGMLDVPSPQECQVAPRQFPLFPEGVGQRAAATPLPLPLPTPPAAPFVPPRGEAADAKTVAAVTATVREAIACRNGNDFLRAYALFTEKMIVSLFGGPATIDPEVGQVIAEQPGPLPRRQRVALVDVSDVVLLPDGRVGAVVDTQTVKQAFRDYLFFTRDPASGRWLIDDARAMGDR
jgi:hypothetical protein